MSVTIFENPILPMDIQYSGDRGGLEEIPVRDLRIRSEAFVHGRMPSVGAYHKP